MAAFEPCLRWFGPADAVTLAHIRQAGAAGVVTALHHLACGEAWTDAEVKKRKEEVDAAGMRWSVAESVPVHESIKQGRADRELYLERYRASLRALGRAGVRTVCYNFMAVTDWTRTDTAMRLPTGALALRYDATDAAAFDLFGLKRPGAERDYAENVRERAERRWAETGETERARIARTILMGLPGTVEDLTPDGFLARLAEYDEIDEDRLHAHHAEFLRAVVPAAEEEGVVLAIHPDDPPFPVFGLPRLAGDEAGLRRVIEAVDSPANGITFCTGSLGARADNDLPGMMRHLGDRVHFLHLRRVSREPDGSFFEDDHLANPESTIAVLREAVAAGDRRGLALPMRPDHGHLMGDDLERSGFYPGYSYVGRLRGLAELRGLELGLRA